MPISTRATAALGFGLAGLIALVSQSTQGQQGDPNVRRAEGGQNQPTRLAPVTIGSIDLERVFQEYERYKDTTEQIQAEMMHKQAQLQELLTEAKGYYEKLQQFKPGTEDYNDWNDKLTEAQAKYEGERKKIQNQMTIRDANAAAQIYNDIRKFTAYVAGRRGLSFVLQAGDNEDISGGNPDEVMAAVSRNVVYRDPRYDITDEVIQVLNQQYRIFKEKASGGTRPQAPSNGQAPARGAEGS